MGTSRARGIAEVGGEAIDPRATSAITWPRWAADVSAAVREQFPDDRYKYRWEPRDAAKVADGKHVAQVLGVSESAWSRIASGVTSPKALVVVRAYAILGVDPRDYLQ